jgi:hypothetical protein
MNPEAPDLKRAQERAAEFVQSIWATVPPLKRVLDVRDRIERGVAGTFRTVGWLARDQEGWRIRTGVATPNQEELSVIVPLENHQAQWRKVGSITGGKPAIDARDSMSLAEGRPVFVIVKSW